MTQRARVFGAILRGSLVERKGRVALAVGAIAIGTSVAAALLLVSRDVGSKVARELRVYGPNAMLAPAAGTLAVGARDFGVDGVARGATFGPRTRHWLEEERAAGRLSSFATLRYGVAHRDGASYALAATDLADLRALYPGWRIEGAPGGDALIGVRAARALRVAPGGMVTLLVQVGAQARPLALRNVAIASTGGGEDRVVFVDRGRLATVTGDGADRFPLALARVEGSGAQVMDYAARPLPAEVRAEAGAGSSLRAIKRLSAADGEVLARLRLLLLTVTAVALLAALLCAMSTLADLVLERTREVALLRAIGAGRRDVLVLFAAEALAIGLVGGAAGLVIGIVAAQAIGHGVFGTSIAIAPLALPVTLALGVLTALVASLAPVRHALSIEAATVLRGE